MTLKYKMLQHAGKWIIQQSIYVVLNMKKIFKYLVRNPRYSLFSFIRKWVLSFTENTWRMWCCSAGGFDCLNCFLFFQAEPRSFQFFFYPNLLLLWHTNVFKKIILNCKCTLYWLINLEFIRIYNKICSE